MIMNVKSFVQRAKEQGIQMLVFQTSPYRRLYSTGKDSEVPTYIGETMAWAAIKIAKVTGQNATEVLQALQVHANGIAFKVVEQEVNRSMEEFAQEEEE